jgi:hypothetical protein
MSVPQTKAPAMISAFPSHNIRYSYSFQNKIIVMMCLVNRKLAADLAGCCPTALRTGKLITVKKYNVRGITHKTTWRENFF